MCNAYAYLSWQLFPSTATVLPDELITLLSALGYSECETVRLEIHCCPTVNSILVQ